MTLNHTENKKPIFLVRLSSIGDVIIAARNVQYFIQNNFEPIFISSIQMKDVLLQTKHLKYLICFDENYEPTCFFDGQQKSIDEIKILFPLNIKKIFCDLQNTTRSRRAIQKTKNMLFNSDKITVFRVQKKFLFRVFLILFARMTLFQKVHVFNKTSIVRIHDLQLKLINKFFLSCDKITFSHSNTVYLSKSTQSNVRNYVSLFPGASGSLKIWPKAHFKILIELILEHLDCDVYICGSTDDLSKLSDLNHTAFASDRVHNIVGHYTLSETLNHIANSSYVVCNDSFPGHVADAYHIPTTVIFGATSPLFGFVPLYSGIKIKYLNLSCSPCSKHGKGICRYQNLKCLNDIHPFEVFSDIKKTFG